MPDKSKVNTEKSRANHTFTYKVKKWYNGNRFVFNSTYNMGLLPYMAGVYSMFAVLGMTAGVILKFVKKATDLLERKNIDYLLVKNTFFFAMLTQCATKCFYMNWINLESQYFGNKEWENTQNMTFLAEQQRQKSSQKTSVITKPEGDYNQATTATVSETEKLITSTHSLNQSIIQAFFSILSSCLALSEVHVPSLALSVGWLSSLIILGGFIQVGYVIGCKTQYKSAKQLTQNNGREIFNVHSNNANLTKTFDSTNNSRARSDEAYWYEAIGQGVYRLMTDASESIMYFSIISMFIPNFKGNKGDETVIYSNFSGLATHAFSCGTLVAVSKALASLIKESATILRSSGAISDIGSAYDQFENTLSKHQPKNAKYPLEHTYRIFLNPKEKSANFIAWNALENLFIGGIISSYLCLYYDSMIYGGVVSNSHLLANSIPGLQLCTAITVIITMTAYLAKAYYTQKVDLRELTFNYGNTIFSLGACSCLSYALSGLFTVVNPMATFCLIFTTAIPIASAFAHVVLVPNQLSKNTKSELNTKINTLKADMLSASPPKAHRAARVTHTYNRLITVATRH